MNRFNALGEIVCDLPPAPGNARNSEGDFIDLPHGGVLFVYSRYRDSRWSDSAPADLYALRSADEGRTFGEPAPLLLCEDDGAVNVMSVSLMRMLNGDIGLFYLSKESEAIFRVYLRRSADNGLTWGPRVLCTPQHRCFVMNNDRAVRLADESIVLPVAAHPTCLAGEEGEADYYDGRSEAMFFLSNDDGKTWRMAEGKCSLPSLAHSRSGLQEPGVVEVRPGILWGWARTDLGRQYEMFSHDGGDTWTAAQPSVFTSPCSPLSMKAMPDGRLLAIWNPIPEYNGCERAPIFTGGRSPLVCAVSADGGRHFSEPVVMEDDSGRGFCYCSIRFTSDAVLLGYCAGGQEDGSCLSRLRIRRVPLSLCDGMTLEGQNN